MFKKLSDVAYIHLINVEMPTICLSLKTVASFNRLGFILFSSFSTFFSSSPAKVSPIVVGQDVIFWLNKCEQKEPTNT